MNMKMKKLLMAGALMASAFNSQLAPAESVLATAGAPLTAAARVDMAIVIPRFLQFQVGAAGAAIDVITFTVPAASVGAGGAGIAGTGGTPGPGAVTVNVKANTGQVTITPSTTATGLANGVAGQFIPFTEIGTTSSDAVNVPAPTLVNGNGVAVNTVLYHPQIGMGEGAGYLGSFPSKREDLQGYDVVFLGDVGVTKGMLSPEQATMLRGLIEQQASGLVFLPGPLGWQKTLKDSPLADLVPVETDFEKGAGMVNFTQIGRAHV